jgi:hypothetical protein
MEAQIENLKLKLAEERRCRLLAEKLLATAHAAQICAPSSETQSGVMDRAESTRSFETATTTTIHARGDRPLQATSM